MKRNILLKLDIESAAMRWISPGDNLNQFYYQRKIHPIEAEKVEYEIQNKLHLMKY